MIKMAETDKSVRDKSQTNEDDWTKFESYIKPTPSVLGVQEAADMWEEKEEDVLEPVVDGLDEEE